MEHRGEMVNSPKVFEFAKEIGMETLALMDKIREWKLPVKSHMAELDAAMIEEIRRRLTEDVKPAADTKKKVVKRGAASKATVKKEEEKEKDLAPIAATPVAAAPTARRTVKKPETSVATEKKTLAKKSVAAAGAAPKVIRRKAGEAEAKAEAEALAAAQRAAEEAAMAQELAARNAQTEESTAGEDLSETGAALSGAEIATSSVPSSPAQEVRKPRNIVGRMDLRRVTPPPGERFGGASGSGGGGGGFQQRGGAAPGGARPMQRPMRPGFVAPPPMDIPPPIEEDIFERRAREDREKKKKAGGGTGAARVEEEVQSFSATEFRKREVIFQPKKKKLMTNRDMRKTQITTPKASKRIVKMYGTIKVSELADQLGVKAPVLTKKLMASGVMATMNTDMDFDTVALIVPEFGFEAQNLHKTEGELLQNVAFGELSAESQSRPPVVTVMGHVDHGKTTLLDTIRKASVAKGEAGGITQHIGAYSVRLESGKEVTFLDTPGHEAFTAMRARGAKVTDIAIIVVAADDGVMPQTAEAINHAKAANVPIIVAVNKIDKPGVTPDRIKQQLTEFELVPEEWGGTTMFCEVSGLTGKGVPELLESVLLQAEVLELKANPKRSATGIVIESRMEKGRGSVATLLVQDGTLKTGDVIVAGTVQGRIRSMMDDKGKTVREVAPGYPVEIMGLPSTPDAGDRFDVCQDEVAAGHLVEERQRARQAELNAAAKPTLEQILAKVKKGDVKELSLVLKADVAGSLEAVRGLLDKSGTTEVKPKVIHAAVGGISESDVLLASTAGGLILGFNVRPDGGAQRVAKEKGVEIKCYSIIYELVDELKKMLSGLLAPEIRVVEQGRAEVRNTFSVPKVGVIAGCAVVEGKISRNHMLRLVRDGRIIYEGKVSSLKRFKDDAREVASGYECGIGIENFNDIKVGDVIEAFTRESIAREI